MELFSIKQPCWQREVKIITSFEDVETCQRYRDAAQLYLEFCQKKPGENRCRVALVAGSMAFGKRISDLQSRARETDLAEVRQQLMAFSRIVSVGPTRRPNSWKGIARVFHRSHATVIYATKKYGDAITKVIGE